MALDHHAASSSSISPLEIRHDVFLNFRGEDVRKGFLSHLYSALCRENYETYKDDDKLGIGDEISQSLLKGIQESKLSIVILSQSYATSTWCLNELVHILKCRRRNGHQVIPVFYGTDPSYVRKQKGSFEDAFKELEKRFKNRLDKVRDWRSALTSASNLKGFTSQRTDESKLVEMIVKDVTRKLNSVSEKADIDRKKLVGIDKHVKAIKSLLANDTRNEHLIGICGMGGIGKSTVASILFSQLSYQFQNQYFLGDVSAGIVKHDCNFLRSKLLGALSEVEDLDIPNRLMVPARVKKRLRSKKVLVVLDDVSDSHQFDEILPRDGIKLADESIIIVTTRNSHVLERIGASVKYEVTELSDREALKLFRMHAFREGVRYTERRRVLSEMVVKHHAKGHPWALKVLGSYLGTRDEKEWKGELANLHATPNQEIQQMLRKSYDGLEYEQQQIFLDIACFFKGEDRDVVESLLDEGREFSSRVKLRDLIDKSLMAIRQNKLWMHKLMQKMGQHIVCEKSRSELRNRCRLWKAEDVRGVLERDAGTNEVHGIFLDMSKMNHPLHLSPTVFSRMLNLRFLKIHCSIKKYRGVYFSQGLQSLPKSLVFFYWQGYPLKFLPPNFDPKNLVELSMPCSQVEKLWNEDELRNLSNLKRIDLGYCENLAQLPNLSSASNVDSINLERCTSLRQVPLPQNLCKLTSLNLKDCTRLENLSVLPRNIKFLNLENCSTLASIPTSICELKTLCSLNLSGCSSLKDFPKISRPMKRLISLILDGTAIKNLPPSIRKLTALKTLSLNNCKNLEVLPNSISCLCSLQSLSVRFCPKLETLPALPPSLASVDARNCTSLKRVFPSKAVTEGWSCNTDHHNGGTFMFCNCQKLNCISKNNIMAEAQLRIMHLANATSKYGGDPAMTEICWCEEEVPEWFRHQSKESSINVTLPYNRLDDSFLGFAFCVVIDFKDCKLDGDFEVYCESHCTFADGFVATWRRTWVWRWNNQHSESAVNSAHAFLFYESGKQILSSLRAGNYSNSSSSANDNKIVSFTFKFKPRHSNGRVNPSYFSVKSCGIQPLYVRDDEEGERDAVEEGVGGTVEEDEDDEEPPPEENQTNSDDQESTSRCSQIRSRILGFCEPRFGKRDGYAAPDQTYTVAVIQIPKAKYEKMIEHLKGVNGENTLVYNAFRSVDISLVHQAAEN